MEPYTLLLSILGLLTYSAFLSHYGQENVIQSLWLIYLKYSSNPKLQELNQLKKDKKQIYIEKTGLSPQDQYAKWTKLNRKFDELSKKIDDLETKLIDMNQNFNKKISMVLKISYWCPMIVFRCWFRKTPVFWLPNGLFPWFIEKLLSWPSAPIGSIGLSQWIFLINAFLNGVLFIYKSLKLQVGDAPIKSTQLQKK